MEKQFPTIDKVKTGKQIRHLMDSLGLTVMDVQKYMGLATQQAVYHFKVFLTSDVVSLNIIKYKSIAQILNVLADGYMIGWSLICCQKLTDLIRRSQIADIIHKELTQTL